MKTLVICFDGLPFSRFNKENTPFLWKFGKQNHSAKLKTLLAFTGVEFSFFSGKWPDEHDVWLEFTYDPKNSPFKWQKGLAFLGRPFLNYLTAFSQHIKGMDNITKLYNIPFKKLGNFSPAAPYNVWHLEMFKSRSYICYKWPFFVRNGKKKIITKYEKDSERYSRLIRAFDDKVDLYSVQLLALDKTTHLFGLDSPQVKKAMKEVDEHVKTLVEEFRKKFPDGKVIVWSDHGFLDVKRFVDVRAYLPKCGYDVFYGGTSVSFWFKDKETKKTVLEKLKTLKFGRVLSDKEKKKYHIPMSEKHGEVIFVVDPGIMIYPNYYQKGEKFKSMHGYAPDRCDCDGVLVTNIPLKKKVYEMPQVLGILKKF